MAESIYLGCDRESGVVSMCSVFSPAVVWSIEGVERLATDSACTIGAASETAAIEDPFLLCVEASKPSPRILAIRKSQLSSNSSVTSRWNIRSLQSNPESGIFHLESTVDSLLLTCSPDGALSMQSSDAVKRWDGWCIDFCGETRDRQVLRPFYAKSLTSTKDSNSTAHSSEPTLFNYELKLPLFLSPRAIPGKPLGVVETRALSLNLASLALKNDKFLVSNATGGATLAIDEGGSVVSTKNKGVQEAFTFDYAGQGQYRIRRTKEANASQLARANSSATGTSSSNLLAAGGSSNALLSAGGNFLLACDDEGNVRAVLDETSGEAKQPGGEDALWRIRKTVKGLLIYVHRRVSLTNLLSSVPTTDPTSTTDSSTTTTNATPSLTVGYRYLDPSADAFPGQGNNYELVQVFPSANTLPPTLNDEIAGVRKLIEADRAFQLLRLFHVRSRYLRLRFDNECRLCELKNGARPHVLSLFQAAPRVTLNSSTSAVFSKSRLSIDMDSRRNGEEKSAIENNAPYGRGYYFAASLKLPHKMNWNHSEQIAETLEETIGDNEKDVKVAVVYYVNIGRCAYFGHGTADSLTSPPLLSSGLAGADASNACTLDPLRFDSVCGLDSHVGGTVIDSEHDGLQFVVYSERQVCPAFLVQYRANPLLEKSVSAK